VLVFEANAGQMIDDVRLSVRDSAPIDKIGGVSVDHSGMRQGELLNVAPIRERIVRAIAERS
jgi:2-oxoglutarate ferredoxin oxidoreductase subunit alpha